MDEKDLEDLKKEDGKGKDIIYETPEPKIMTVNEARAAYSVDEEKNYLEYLNLPEDLGELVEFIECEIIYSGSPTPKHQEILFRLGARFEGYLDGKSCRAYASPLDVKIDFDLNPASRNTLQPDLIVICDDKKIDEKCLLGTPDLVIEILSPSTARRDKAYKFNKYRSVGVKEYWIIDPVIEEIMVNLLSQNRQKYNTKTYKKGEVIKVSIFGDLIIDVTGLFEGYKGETPEVKVAREEEREKAIEMEKLAREEEKLATIKRFLKMGLSTSEVARGAEVDLDIVIKVSKELDSNNE